MKIYNILTRIFIDATALEGSIDFYEQLFGEKCELRFTYPEHELELAMIGSILLVAGSPDHLQAFTDTKVTLLVDSIEEFLGYLTLNGSTILEYPKSVPTGKNMRVKHPDGLIAEYVEHKTEEKHSQAH